jgi:hypothetical protein
VPLSPVERPPAGSDWLHEIKHDGFRLLARRGAERVRLFTRNGHDWTERFPLIVEALNALKATTCLIDGEAARLAAIVQNASARMRGGQRRWARPPTISTRTPSRFEFTGPGNRALVPHSMQQG